MKNSNERFIEAGRENVKNYKRNLIVSVGLVILITSIQLIGGGDEASKYSLFTFGMSLLVFEVLFLTAFYNELMLIHKDKTGYIEQNFKRETLADSFDLYLKFRIQSFSNTDTKDLKFKKAFLLCIYMFWPIVSYFFTFVIFSENIALTNFLTIVIIIMYSKRTKLLDN